jgi:iron(II)-dependent oxidoreductase
MVALASHLAGKELEKIGVSEHDRPNILALFTESGRIVNITDGADMIWIPAGEFVMGDEQLADNPRRTIALSGYWIYKNLVTVGQFKKYCIASGLELPPAPVFNSDWMAEDHPMVSVTWDDAQAYCQWAGVSLPSEAQWERAARGTDARGYPWDGEFDNDKLWCSVNQKRIGTTPVGQSGVSPCGCTDMAGNVWQWCSDWYDGEYWKCAPATDPDGPEAGDSRVVRGGSWAGTYRWVFRTAYRGRYDPNGRIDRTGFRCVSAKE